jgi:hypothetical protein
VAKKAVNHPPAPVVESLTDPETGEVDCEKLKEHYKLNVDTYKDHEEVKSRSNQSHHILQDATVVDYIDKAKGLCVLLGNSHSGTPHQVTTRRQNERRDNKKYGRAGTKPAKTFGDLKELSKGDLEESFKKKKIPDEDAKALAECLVAEAEEEAKMAAKLDKKKNLNNKSPVKQTGGCLVGHASIWLADGTRKRVVDLTMDDVIEGLGRARAMVRRDWCRSDLVTVSTTYGAVSLAPFHRVRMGDERYRRADAIRPGMTVRTRRGTETVTRVRHVPRPRRIVSVGVGDAFECQVGRAGLWVELPNTGVRVAQTVRLRRYRGGVRR